MGEQHKRWKVTLIYRSEVGPVDVEHFVEELDEIFDLVEAGPDWNTLIEGHFVLNRGEDGERLTVEEAEAR